MPSGASASTTAFHSALIDPVVPDSPMPFAPERVARCRRHGVSGAERMEARPPTAPRSRRASRSAGCRRRRSAPPRTASGRCLARGRRAPDRSASNGLITVPQSSTATRSRRATAPVSRSISTTATWHPNGNVPDCSKSSEWVSGLSFRVRAATASSAHERPVDGHACHAEPAVVEHDHVVDGSLEQIGGESPRLEQHLLRGSQHRGAGELQRPRPERAGAVVDAPRVGVHDSHRLERHAERGARNLRPHRLVALSVGDAA